MTKATYEYSNDYTGDTSKAAIYEKAIKMIISDAEGNSNSTRAMVIVYNPDNKTAPTVTLKTEFPKVTMDTPASDINWTSFIESAVDADGLDVLKVAENVTADISKLDTTTPATYKVTVTVSDYAGNKTDVVVDVVVE